MTVGCGHVQVVHGPYDAVVVAAPLEQANITFKGIQLPHMPPRKYQSTISTFIRGKLDPKYFHRTQVPPGTDLLWRRSIVYAMHFMCRTFTVGLACFSNLMFCGCISKGVCEDAMVVSTSQHMG